MAGKAGCGEGVEGVMPPLGVCGGPPTGKCSKNISCKSEAFIDFFHDILKVQFP